MSAIRTKSAKKSGSKSKKDADHVDVKLHSSKRVDDLDREASLSVAKAVAEQQAQHASGSKSAAHKIQPEGAPNSQRKNSPDKKSHPNSRSGSRNKVGGRPRDDKESKKKAAAE